MVWYGRHLLSALPLKPFQTRLLQELSQVLVDHEVFHAMRTRRQLPPRLRHLVPCRGLGNNGHWCQRQSSLAHRFGLAVRKKKRQHISKLYTLNFPVLSISTELVTLIGSLSNNIFERRTLTGSGLFSFFDGSFAQIFSQIASITVKKLRNTNFISSRHIKRENNSVPVDVRRSKTSLLKLPINNALVRGIFL